MRILVTGATGFVGITLRSVSESLADVIAWMRDEGYVTADAAGAVP